MKIDFFSADLKLVDADKPESRSFRILEFNDGLTSGFTGYDALVGEPMVSGRIVADYKDIFIGNQILTSNTWGSRNYDSGSIILIPRGDDVTNYMPRLALTQAVYMDPFYKSVSSDLHFRGLSWNKAYQHHMAVQAGMGELFPRSEILPTAFHAAAQAIMDMARDTGRDMILKPVGSFGGMGVRLIRADRPAPAQVKKIFSPWRFKDWAGLRDPVCLLQDRVPVNEVDDGGKIFDGTMRVVFSVYGEGDERRAVVHDAYWKLPSHEIGAGKGEEDFVSFSPSNFERKRQNKPKPKFSPEEDYKNLLASFGCEDSEAEEVKPRERIHSVAVSPAIKEWLFASFGGAMARYFSHVAKTDFEQETILLVSSDKPVMQGLGWMMATHPHYYPAADGKVSMNYPVHLRDAITKSDMIFNTGNYMHHRLKLALDTMDGHSIQCEGMSKNFIRPIEKAIKTRSQPIFMDAVWAMMSKMPR